MPIPPAIYVAVLASLGLSGVAAARQPIPKNAHPSMFGGWECDRGFRPVRGACQPVRVPENAHLDLLGHSWECDRGFRPIGERCEPVVVPKNAHLDLLGHGWECDRGYRPSGAGCQPVIVPENAHLDLLGHGWECDRAYRVLRDKCQPVFVPEHAHLDLLGHDWECDAGFKPAGEACVPMTAAQREAQRILTEAAIARYRAGIRDYDVSGDCDGKAVTGTVEGHRGSSVV